MSTSEDQSSPKQAGEKSSEGPKLPLYDPWESIAPTPPEKAIGAPEGTKTKLPVRDPWERLMSNTAPSRPVPKDVTRNASEEKMAQAVVLTKSEQERGDRYDVSDANIRELTAEISKTDDLRSKQILQKELKRLLKLRGQ